MRKRMRKRVSQHFLEKDFLFKLGDLLSISGLQFALSNLRIDLSMLPWQQLKLRSSKNDIF